MTRLARIILWLEPLVLALTGLAFWYPTPTRTDWLWLLLLLIPLAAARWIVQGRLFTRTPLDLWFLIFLILGAANVSLAPYTRGLMLLARPLLGMALAYALVEAARTAGSLRGPLQAMTLLALLVGLLAIGSTQWSGKSAALQPFLDVLPTLRNFPGAEGGFNPNEIAGALAWLTPLMAGLMVERWQRRALRWDVTLAFVMLFGALFLGQSRSALIGVFVALFVMTPVLVRGRVGRLIVFGTLVAAVAAQVWVSVDFARQNVPLPEVVTEAQTAAEADAPVPLVRDEASLVSRVQIWSSALEITLDHPLTGVGMSMFRDNRVRRAYPVPIMESKIVPHAHNELLQIAADMGLPGLVVFLGFYGAAGFMLLHSWRGGDAQARVVSVAVAGGLLAHFIFGLADAIPLWDRFAFVYWLLLGLAAAQYELVIHPPTRQEKSVRASRHP